MKLKMKNLFNKNKYIGSDESIDFLLHRTVHLFCFVGTATQVGNITKGYWELITQFFLNKY